jgi:hypothetical protein
MKSSSSGVIDTCGFKKDGFYFYQSQWTDKPVQKRNGTDFAAGALDE